MLEKGRMDGINDVKAYNVVLKVTRYHVQHIVDGRWHSIAGFSDRDLRLQSINSGAVVVILQKLSLIILELDFNFCIEFSIENRIEF